MERRYSDDLSVVILKLKSELEQAERSGLADTDHANDLRTRIEMFREKRLQAFEDESEAVHETEDDATAE